MATNGNGNGGAWRLLTLIAPIVTAVNLGIAAWIVRMLFGLQAEHVEMWRELAVKANLSDVPPAEVIRRLDSHDAQIDKLRDRVSAINGGP